MANVIIKNENRKADAEHIMKTYGVDRRDPAMREAAEIAAARTNEAVRMSQNRRRYLQDYDAGLFRNPSELSWYVGALQ